jgi:PAS domain S-box-containing protein
MSRLKKKLRLLLIGRNPAIGRLLQKNLSDTPHGVPSAAAAAPLLKEGKIDVLFIEASTLGKSLTDNLKEIVAKNRHVPILVIADTWNEQDALGAIESGAQDSLVKDQISSPFIWRAVHYALGRQRIRMSHQRSREQMAAIVENSEDAIFRREMNGNIQTWNTGAEKLFGYTKEEILGKSVQRLVPADKQDEFLAIADNLKRGNGLYHVETIRLHKNGTRIPVSLSISQIKSPEAQVIGVSVIARDISERNRVIEELKESERRFRQMAENIREVFWMTDIKKNKMIYISPGYEEIWGRTCQSLYSSPQTWVDAISPDDRDRVLNSAMTNQVAGKYNEEYKIIRPDGSVRWIWDRAFPVKDSNGKVYRVVGIAEDITEVRAAHAALQEEEGRLRLILEQIPAIVWSVDKDFVITSSIGLGLKALGLKAGELVGKTLWEYLGTNDPDHPTVAAITRAMNGETVSLDLEYKGIYFQSRFQPLKNKKDQITGAAAVSLNVTDRKMLEDQFRQAQKMEAVGQLAGGVAHDFNNILNIIIGYSDMLSASAGEDATSLEDIEEIRKAAKRAAGLTHQLLAFSRQQALQPRVLNLNEEIDDLEKMLARLVGEDIHWELSLAPDLWVVRADPGQVQQVLINLAVNARDAMPKGGRFTIKTHNSTFYEASSHSDVPPGEYVTMVVSDTGVGMDTETKARAFEPFYTTKEKGKGTGLGLSLVYGVVRQSNGYITIDSEINKGTSFTIYLPKTDEPLKKEANAREPLRLNGKLETILVVEDEIPVQRLVSRILSKNGFKVLLASNGEEALGLVDNHGAELTMILTDIVLPDIRGDEIAKRILVKFPELKILYMSGYVDRDFGDFNVDESVAFLQKPFSPDALTLKVRSILNSR